MIKPIAVTGLMLCLASVAGAQEPICVIDGARHPAADCGFERSPSSPQQAPTDPLARYLFPPELVMAHQQEIGLTDRQRSAIQEAIKEAQGRLIDLQFKMSGEVEKLQRLVQGASVDEAKALDQADRLLTIERDVKHVQLTLMVRIKNTLTEPQQTALAKRRM